MEDLTIFRNKNNYHYHYHYHISDQTIKDSDIVDHHHVTLISASINLTFIHQSCTIWEDSVVDAFMHLQTQWLKKASTSTTKIKTESQKNVSWLTKLFEIL